MLSDLKPVELLLILLVVAVPVALVLLTVIMVKRSRHASRSGPPVVARTGQPALTSSVHQIPIAGGEITFARTGDGQMVTTSQGFVGEPSPEIVRDAQQRLIGWQMAKNETSWFA